MWIMSTGSSPSCTTLLNAVSRKKDDGQQCIVSNESWPRCSKFFDPNTMNEGQLRDKLNGKAALKPYKYYLELLQLRQDGLRKLLLL